MRQMDVQRELNMEGWRRARFIAYQAIRPHLKNQHLSITDFMPLEGDQSKHSEAESLAVIEHYKRKGWLKEAKA